MLYVGYHSCESKYMFFVLCGFQMSLFIGNLSARTRRDELELVFRRFGRCNVQLKDGYGFVVYDFSPNAEKALRTLEGRIICGERLNLTWSNKQPRPFQNFGRGSRTYELRGRNSGSRRMSSNDWRDNKSGIKQPDGDGVRLNSEEMLGEGRDYHQEDMKDFIGEERYNFREDLPTDGGIVVEKTVDNGRWGEQVDDLSNDNGDNNGIMFDRYEPYQGYDGKDKDENHWMVNSGGSGLQSSQENVGRNRKNDIILNRPNDSKSRQTCYNCGGAGHKMRNCTRQHYSRKKFTRFDRRQYDDIRNRSRGEGKLDRFGSKSWGKLQSGRDTALRRHRNDRRESDSGKVQMLIKNGNSPVIKQTDSPQRRDHEGKKRSRWETGSPKRYTGKKARRSVSSSFHSGYPASRSHSTSKSSKSLRRSVSQYRSRSVSSGGLSLSSKSRSSSKSNYSKSRGTKFRSSPTTSLSLSVSLGLPPSSPDKAPLNHKESVDNATSTEFKGIQVEKRELIQGDTYLENSKVENVMVALNIENAVPAFNLEDEIREDQSLGKNDDISSRPSFEITNPGTPLPEKDALVAGSLSPEQPDSETPSNTHTGHSTSISMEEMCMVLKHYGLELPKENERHLPLEALFGCARLWPWEIMYYRRMRKGPISKENYARRVAQNQEFGIVDKYIRSSSGWGEMDQVSNDFVA